MSTARVADLGSELVLEPLDAAIVNIDRAVVLSPAEPLRSARALVRARYTVDGAPTLIHHKRTFYRWAGGRYIEADGEGIRAAAWDFLDAASVMGKKGPAPFRPNSSKVSNVVDALAACANLDAALSAPCWIHGAEDVPPAEEMFPVRNGAVHLPSGLLYDVSPNLFNLHGADWEYNPDAPEPRRWLEFLSTLWPDDPESIATLQEFVGYALGTDTSLQKILLVVGPTRAGKGTIQRVVTGLLGHASVVNPTLTALESNFGLQPLIGKSLAIVSDARLGGRADQARIAERLLSISGEDSLTIDRKFKDAWTGQLKTRFMVMSNELPRLADASGALAKRFVVLVLTRSFLGHEDPGLSARLLTELPGIFLWAREGWERLRDRGYFLQPPSSQGMIEELEALGSPIKAFINERCRVGTGLSVDVSRLFREWGDWCAANGRKETGTVQSFGRELLAACPGVQSTRPRAGDQRIRAYQGIEVVHEFERQG
jgi:putative DNA primase/helicase